MFQFTRSVDPITEKSRSLMIAPRHNLSVLVLPLFLGLLSGGVLGCFIDPDSLLRQVLPYFLPGTDTVSFLRALWNSICFPLGIALLSTSMLGVLLIPLSVYFCGFLLSCSVAAAFQAQEFQGMAISVLTCGIPALLALPALLLSSADGWRFSRRLAGCVIKRTPFLFERNEHILIHVVLIFSLLILEALYRSILLPILIDMMI